MASTRKADTQCCACCKEIYLLGYLYVYEFVLTALYVKANS